MGCSFVEVAEANFGPILPPELPFATVFSPTNGTVYNTSSISCMFSAGTLNSNHIGIQNYEDWVIVYLDNKILQTLYFLPYSYTLTLENLTDGPHHLEITANTKSAILTAHLESGRTIVDFTIQVPSTQPSIQPTPTPTVIPTLTSTPTPSPNPSPTPSSPPTLDPTLEPTLSSTPTDENQTLDLTPTLALTGLFVVAVTVGALVFLKRRKP